MAFLPRTEDEILSTCALRFDGWKYIEDTGYDHNAALSRYLRSGRWPRRRSERLASFFTLQRYLMKWGGEREPTDGPAWRAFRELFLELYACPIPARYRMGEWYDTWESRYREHADEYAEVVREIHERTVYEKDAPSAE